MNADQDIIKESGKSYPKFANFGEYLFWSSLSTIHNLKLIRNKRKK